MGKFTDEQIRATSINQVCECGRHKGKGQATAHEQAMIYNWFRQKNHASWQRNEGDMQTYLFDYEKYHGRLGGNEFIYNSSRWQHMDSVIKCRNSGKLDW